MKQDDLSVHYQNKAIEYCRALLADDANAEPGTRQRTALALLTILDTDDTELNHFGSGERFSVTFHKGTDAHKAEGAVILQGVDKPPVGVLVARVGTAGAPVGTIARMGAEDEPAEGTRTGQETAAFQDFSAACENADIGPPPADDGTVGGDAEGGTGA